MFETIEKLKDDEKPMEIERARAISEVAQTIINTAKVEVQYLDAIGAESNGRFFEGSKTRQLGNGERK